MKLYPNSLLDKLGFEHIRQATLELAQSERSEELLEKLQPSSNSGRVKRLLEQCREMLEVLNSPDPFPLGEFPEVRNYLSKAKAVDSIIPLPAFVDIFAICTSTRHVKSFFKARAGHLPQLNKFADGLI
ncbi:MAG: endonuclease MutS2, partial [Balneolaceae bacterium]